MKNNSIKLIISAIAVVVITVVAFYVVKINSKATNITGGTIYSPIETNIVDKTGEIKYISENILFIYPSRKNNWIVLIGQNDKLHFGSVESLEKISSAELIGPSLTFAPTRVVISPTEKYALLEGKNVVDYKSYYYLFDFENKRYTKVLDDNAFEANWMGEDKIIYSYDEQNKTYIALADISGKVEKKVEVGGVVSHINISPNMQNAVITTVEEAKPDELTSIKLSIFDLSKQATNGISSSTVVNNAVFTDDATIMYEIPDSSDPQDTFIGLLHLKDGTSTNYKINTRIDAISNSGGKIYYPMLNKASNKEGVGLLDTESNKQITILDPDRSPFGIVSQIVSKANRLYIVSDGVLYSINI